MPGSGNVLSVAPTLPERRTGSISRNISMPRVAKAPRGLARFGGSTSGESRASIQAAAVADFVLGLQADPAVLAGRAEALAVAPDRVAAASRSPNRTRRRALIAA